MASAQAAHPGQERPDLTDELWTPTHLAAYLHCARSTAYATAAEPGFPPALHVGRRGRRLWLATEIRSWAREAPRSPRAQHRQWQTAQPPDGMT